MKSTRGFTLMELLVYSAVFAITAGLLTAVLSNVVRVRDRESNSTEIAQQLNFVLNNIQSVVNDASLIESVYDGNTPGVACDQFCTVLLRMEDSALDPTIISSDVDGVYLKQASNATSTLTDAGVRVDHLKFTKFEFAGGHASVRVSLSLTLNPDNPRLAVTRSVQSAIGRANAAIFDSNLIPNATEAFDIGSDTFKWQNAYLSGDLTIDGTCYGCGGAWTTSGTDIYYNDGDVGIGTATPVAPLTVVNSSPLLVIAQSGISVNSADSGVIDLIEVGGAGTLGTIGSVDNYGFRIKYDGSDNVFKVQSGSQTTVTDRLAIERDTGEVGIDTITPAAKLEVADNGSAVGARLLQVGDDSFFTDVDTGNFLGLYGGANSDRAGLRLGSDGSYIFGDGGNIGIGTTSPGSKLDVSGDVRVSGAFNSTGDNIQFHTNQVNNTTYEWIGFYSGATRQGIILYDGAWSSCSNTTIEFCIRAENGNDLTLSSDNDFKLRHDNTLFLWYDASDGWLEYTPATENSLNSYTFRWNRGGDGRLGYYASSITTKENVQPLSLLVRGFRYDDSIGQLYWGTEMPDEDDELTKEHLIDYIQTSSFTRNDETGNKEWGFISENLNNIDQRLTVGGLDQALVEPDVYALGAVTIDAVRDLRYWAMESEERISSLENGGVSNRPQENNSLVNSLIGGIVGAAITLFLTRKRQS